MEKWKPSMGIATACSVPILSSSFLANVDLPLPGIPAIPMKSLSGIFFFENIIISPV